MGSFISNYYKIGKLLCSANALKKGKSHKRLLRIQAGKMTTRSLFNRSIFK